MFKAGQRVTHQMSNAVVQRVSTAKRGYVYIVTEAEGTILVPVSELALGWQWHVMPVAQG